MNRYDNILQTVGNTPVVRINRLAPKHVNLWAKLEAFNPMSSVKDRLALGIIEDAEKRGTLKPGQTVIEATSGNTGIGLAMVCAAKGHPLVVVMAENFSIERRKLMRFLGAKVVLTPASEKGSGMLKKAIELAEKHDWFLCRQFENEANADMHSRTTAPEIIEAFADGKLDYWVSGYGTGGTLKGVARILKERSPDTRIVVCEPDNSQVLGSGIPQPRDENGKVSASHPLFRPHLMQGWGPDFIPKLTEDAVEQKWIDQVIPVSGDDAMRLTRALARKEGIFSGISGGATLAGALQICESAPDGANILCMLPDTGERYLTTPLFDGIPEEMTAQEKELSASTPSCQFGGSASTPPPKIDEAEVTPEARDFVEQVVADKELPVVMFAHEWCEFCWSVRKLFAHYGIEYRSIDLDSVAYQADDKGRKIRTALNAKTSMVTIPQIFVGGEFIGGCTELFDAMREGRVQSLLEKSGKPLDKEIDIDPYKFLPAWLQPR